MVTIIIPTYKRAEYIERAIDSVLIQSYKNIELIVVDDNDKHSIDRKKMIKIMKKYKNDKRVIYIKHDKNLNGAAARNTGINLAKGKYITFLDDDDFFLENRIFELVNVLEENIDYAAAYTGGFVVENGKIIDIFSSTVEGKQKFLILKQNSFIRTGSNMFFRADALKKLNGFDINFLRHQDLELLVRFFRNYKIKAVDSFSVIKDIGSRINSPDINKAICYKEFYLNCFKNDIMNYKNYKDIYSSNYHNLLVRCEKKSDEYDYILKKLNEYECRIDNKFLFKQKIIKLVKKTFLKNIFYLLRVIKKINNKTFDSYKQVKIIINKY